MYRSRKLRVDELHPPKPDESDKDLGFGCFLTMEGVDQMARDMLKVRAKCCLSVYVYSVCVCVVCFLAYKDAAITLSASPPPLSFFNFLQPWTLLPFCPVMPTLKVPHPPMPIKNSLPDLSSLSALLTVVNPKGVSESVSLLSCL